MNGWPGVCVSCSVSSRQPATRCCRSWQPLSVTWLGWRRSRRGSCALRANQRPLNGRPHLDDSDFIDQTLITDPVPDDRPDLVRQVLETAGVRPPYRTTEYMVGILQLAASRRGLAVPCLPLPDQLTQTA